MTACSVPRLFWGETCSIRTDNVQRRTCLTAGLYLVILTLFFSFVSSLIMPTFQSFLLRSLCNSFFLFVPFPPSLAFSFLLSFILLLLLFFFTLLSVFPCVDFERKN